MKSLEKELFAICFIVDLFILNGCFVIFHRFRLDAFPDVFPGHLMYFLHFNVCWAIAYFAFARKNLYLREGFSNRIYKITKRVLVYSLIATLTIFLFLSEYYSSHFLVEFIAFLYFGLIGANFLIFKYLIHKRKKGLNTIRTVIISDCEKAYRLRKILESNPMLGYKFLGFIVHENCKNNQDILGTTMELEKLVQDHQVNMVISIQNNNNQAFNHQLISKCDKYGVRLRFVMGLNHSFRLQQNIIETDDDIELLNPHKTPRDYAVARITKRLFDIIFASFFILFVFSWLLPIVALIIKLSSKGPVFFYQKRTGFNNKTFSCIKFRTMRPNFLSDIKQATTNDIRITPIGLFLRNSHIDEMPQIFNVFLGQMSVIGPRPHMLKHTEQYSELIKHYLIRHYVKPGITGWAQVNGYCGETDELWKMEKRVEYDMFYVDNWSFYLDLQIMWYTVFKMKKIKMPLIESEFRESVSKENRIMDDARVVPEDVYSEI